jgi:predicted ABC-type ATPase
MLHYMPDGSDVLSALILAGPNGAGKTTFARALLGASSSTLTFLNADIIAAELSPGAPERVAMEAGRRMLSAIRQCVANKQSFAVETTLSDHAYARMIPSWRAQGFHVSLWFLSLPTADAAI